MSALGDIIDRAHALRARIEADKRDLATLEKAIVAHALAHPEAHEPLKDEEREGRQFLARGERIAVPVIFTSDQLIKSFTGSSETHRAIIEAAGGPEPAGHFYRPVATFKTLFDDGKAFRAKAREVLGDRAATFIAACVARDKDGIPKSATKIDWDRATNRAPAPDPSA